MKFYIDSKMLMLGFQTQREGKTASGVSFCVPLCEGRSHELKRAWHTCTPYVVDDPSPIFLEVKKVKGGYYIFQAMFHGHYIMEELSTARYQEIAGKIDSVVLSTPTPSIPSIEEDETYEPDASEISDASEMLGVSTEGILPSGRHIDFPVSPRPDLYERQGVSYTNPAIC